MSRQIIKFTMQNCHSKFQNTFPKYDIEMQAGESTKLGGRGGGGGPLPITNERVSF